MGKFFKNLFTSRTGAYTVATCSAVVLYMFLSRFPTVRAFFGTIYYYIAPFIGGILLAYLLNPVTEFLSERCMKGLKSRRMARNLAILLTVLLLLAILMFLVGVVLPQLISSCQGLVTNLSSYFGSLEKTLNDLVARLEFMEDFDIDLDRFLGSWNNLLSLAINYVLDNFMNLVNASVKIGSSIFNGIIMLAIAIYALADKDSLIASVKRLGKAIFSPKAYDGIGYILGHSNRMMIRFIGSDLVDGVIVGVANFIFMMLAGMPYPMLVSVIVGVTNLVPTFGPFAGGAAACLIILIINPIQAIWFLVWIVILQQIDGNVIKPLFFGEAMGLPSVWILVSIVVGGRMYGVMGMLVAVPVAAILGMILKEAVHARLVYKGMEDETGQEGKLFPHRKKATENAEPNKDETI